MNKIITCIDASIYANDVCTAGIWAAKKLRKPLVLVHAIEKKNTPTANDFSGAIGLGARSSLLAELASLDAQHSKVAIKLGKDLLTQAQQCAAEQGCKQIEQVLRHGSITDVISDLEADARLVVIGRTRKHFKALGSNIEQIIRQVQTPILILNQGFTKPQSFMLAYDGRETADKAVQRIIEGGLLQGMDCHLVTVENNKKGLKESFERVSHQLTTGGFTVKASFLTGNIFTSLMDYQAQNDVDLLVMGAFSHSKLASIFLGSNTLRMLENTQLPLVILR